jgi:hypothetical protein
MSIFNDRNSRKANRRLEGASKNKLAIQAIYDDFKKLQSECHENHRKHLWTVRGIEMSAIVAVFAGHNFVMPKNAVADTASLGLLLLIASVFAIIELVDHARHKVHEKILVGNQNVLKVADDEYTLSEYKYWASAWEEISFGEKVKASLLSMLGIQFLSWSALKAGIVIIFGILS